MIDAALLLYDDATAAGWHPFTATRPAGELMFGALTLRARAERVLGARCVGHLAAGHLRGFDERSAARVLDDPPPSDQPRLYLNARSVLDWSASFGPPAHPATLRIGGEVAGYWLPAGHPGPAPEALVAGEADVDSAGIDLPGRLLRHVWELMSGSSAQIEHDIAAAAPPPWPLPDHVTVLGEPTAVRAARDVTIEPGTVLDVRDGPIWLDERATVRAFTRLAGPAYVGPGSTLLGGTFSGIALGPVCKVRGEVEETVILGYANKAHDGFLGHAYLGRWVNLGALTTNSDLKNNYGTIRIWTPRGETDTGEIKIGCLLGDHVKTGIGVMLNTGTVIGAGSNVFGAEQPPKYIPAFSWGAGDDLRGYDFDKFLATAATVMQRRDVALTPGMRSVLRNAWRAARDPEAQ